MGKMVKSMNLNEIPRPIRIFFGGALGAIILSLLTKSNTLDVLISEGKASRRDTLRLLRSLAIGFVVGGVIGAEDIKTK